MRVLDTKTLGSAAEENAAEGLGIGRDFRKECVIFDKQIDPHRLVSNDRKCYKSQGIYEGMNSMMTASRWLLLNLKCIKSRQKSYTVRYNLNQPQHCIFTTHPQIGPGQSLFALEHPAASNFLTLRSSCLSHFQWQLKGVSQAIEVTPRNIIAYIPRQRVDPHPPHTFMLRASHLWTSNAVRTSF